MPRYINLYQYMESLLYNIHYYNRYLVLAALVIVLALSFSGWFGKRSYGKADNAAGGALLGFAHLQALVGLIQYFFTSPKVSSALLDMGAAMKDPLLRYFAVEHITAMLLAVVLIQVGRTMSKKKSSDEAKHKTVAIYTAIAAFIIIISLAPKGLLLGAG